MNVWVISVVYLTQHRPSPTTTNYVSEICHTTMLLHLVIIKFSNENNLIVNCQSSPEDGLANESRFMSERFSVNRLQNYNLYKYYIGMEFS